MKRVATSIDIAAPPEHVWAILTDFPAHARWNPFITDIAGEPKQGGRLSIRVHPPGGKGMTFKPRLLVVAPGRELRWLGRLLVPGLFDGEHYFLLEPIAAGTRLTHGENFSGLFVALTGRAGFARIEAGFEAMNRALKARAEAPASA
jgi:hypothetical protein